MSKMIRVLIVDDHVVVREGTELLLAAEADHIEVVGKASDGEEALRMLPSLRPDIMLLDLNMPGLKPVDVILKALSVQPDIRVLVVTGSTEPSEVADAIRAGGMGYLSKNSKPSDYIRAIERLHRGESYLSADLTRELLREEADDKIFAELTDREREVLRLVALGWDNHRIAGHFHIAEVTARTHISRLLSKVGVSNRVEAARLALKHGLASLDETPESSES